MVNTNNLECDRCGDAECNELFKIITRHSNGTAHVCQQCKEWLTKMGLVLGE